MDGSAGGRFWNFYQENWEYQGPLYRHLLVVGTDQPLHFYHLNTEHSQGEANSEFRDVTGPIRIFGFKGEGAVSCFLILSNLTGTDPHEEWEGGEGGSSVAWPWLDLPLLATLTYVLSRFARCHLCVWLCLSTPGNYAQLWFKRVADVLLLGYGGNASPFPAKCSYPPGYAPFMPSLIRVEECGTATDGMFDNISLVFFQLHASPHPRCASPQALLGAHADRVLTGACNPMVCPIHIFRHGGPRKPRHSSPGHRQPMWVVRHRLRGHLLRPGQLGFGA